MKKIITVISVLLMCFAVNVSAINLNDFEANPNRYIAVVGAEGSKVYFDKQSIKAINLSRTKVAIDVDNYMTILSEKKIVKIKRRYYYDLLNKQTISYKMMQVTTLTYYGYEQNVANVANEGYIFDYEYGQKGYDYGDAIFKMAFGKSFYEY